MQRPSGRHDIDTFDLSNMEALRVERGRGAAGGGLMRPGAAGWLRGGSSEADHEAIEGQLDEERIDSDAPSPLGEHWISCRCRRPPRAPP